VPGPALAFHEDVAQDYAADLFVMVAPAVAEVAGGPAAGSTVTPSGVTCSLYQCSAVDWPSMIRGFMPILASCWDAVPPELLSLIVPVRGLLSPGCGEPNEKDLFAAGSLRIYGKSTTKKGKVSPTGLSGKH
jgi:hypothetical protein